MGIKATTTAIGAAAAITMNMRSEVVNTPLQSCPSFEADSCKAGSSVMALNAADCLRLEVYYCTLYTDCEGLRGLRSDVYCIGDAVSPRPLEAIIYEAEALARSL